MRVVAQPVEGAAIVLAAGWMYTVPRYGVLHVRFPMVFCRRARAHAHGCFRDSTRGSDSVRRPWA